MDVKEIKIRFDERMKIYGASQNCNTTFGDLAQVYEDFTKLLDLVTVKPVIGFGA